MIPALLRMTAAAAIRVEGALARADVEGDERLAPSIDAIHGAWCDAVELIGARPAGLWAVEFDAGDGCFCWRWPEADVVRYRPRGERPGDGHPLQ